MGKTLYLECMSGLSGDMTVAALLDLGADEQKLYRAIESLGLEGASVKIERVVRSGLSALDFEVVFEKGYETRDHDMEYLFGEGEVASEGGSGHDHPEERGGEASSRKLQNGDHHCHRHLSDIFEIIDRADMTERARKLARRIFQILAKAESAAHGIPAEEVHFHEVGAVDSIIDIVACAVLTDSLDIDDVVIEELFEGRGTINSAHGILPIPVPAVSHIAAEYGFVLRRVDMHAELVTPTGAAIAAALRTIEHLPDAYRILKTGLGAGKRNYSRPSILRAMLIEEARVSERNPDSVPAESETAGLIKLETNIDDSSGEMLGRTLELLLEAGARDCYFTPCFMKKNRPGYILSVIAMKKDTETLEDIIYRETTTIGIRHIPFERSVLERYESTFLTSLGEARVKICTTPGKEGIIRCYPEYESVRALAIRNGLGFREVYELIRDEYFAENPSG